MSTADWIRLALSWIAVVIATSAAISARRRNRRTRARLPPR